MNPADAKANFILLEKEIGPRAEIYVSLAYRGHQFALHANVYPAGMSASRGDLRFDVGADTFEQLLAGVRAKWAEHSEVHRKQLINKLAHTIIDITCQFGACTDAALRGAGFAPEDIAVHGAAACLEANAMAACGPFSIATPIGANAPAGVETHSLQ